jgi:hypothetical protein
MRITGRDFGPVHLTVKAGEVVVADRPISYMRGWSVARVLKLAERWGWKVDVYADERTQLERLSEPAA